MSSKGHDQKFKSIKNRIKQNNRSIKFKVSYYQYQSYNKTEFLKVIAYNINCLKIKVLFYYDKMYQFNTIIFIFKYCY